MGWVRDSYFFPPRSKWLCLPRARALMDAIKLLDENPDVLEVAVRSIIKEHRPELADCTIHAMGMNYERCRWEVHVEHPSFPVVDAGTVIPRELLSSEEGR